MAKWHTVLPAGCLHELVHALGTCRDCAPTIADTGKPGSEARQQSLVRLEAARRGILMFRNNVGALMDDRGVPVRYGLANESKQQNEVLKSADLIGITPRLIVAADVGKVIGQFTAREMKEEGWTFNPKDKHEVAQLAFIELVISKGGDASFATGPGSFNYTSRNP